MSSSLLRPDFKADIVGLDKRLGVLERRTTPAPTTIISGSGGGSCITVAAVDTPPILAASANFVCDGVDDDIEINAALDAAVRETFVVAGTFGPRVVLLPGNFLTSSELVGLGFTGMSLEGSGRGATFIGYDGTGYAIRFEDYYQTLAHLQMFVFAAGDCVQLGVGSFGTNIFDCAFASFGATGVRCEGQGAQVTNNIVYAPPGNDAVAVTGPDTIITGNFIRADVTATGARTLIVGNRIEGTLTNTGTGSVSSGNIV